MKKILEEIQIRRVCQGMDRSKIKAGRPQYTKLLERDKNHRIEKVGEELREADVVAEARNNGRGKR